ncbi:MAG TPA: hypothetical protein VFE92_15925 [Dermatophilaceae bacterium]|nr:hypothetical protein [Dermatophilaceae bacterium]
MVAEVCDDVWGQVDGASAGGGFRRGDHPGSADGDNRLLDTDRFLVEVDVAPAQAGEFPEPETAPGGEEFTGGIVGGEYLLESIAGPG